eukprot:g3351.t1
MGTAEKLREAERMGLPLEKRLDLANTLTKVCQIQLETARLRLRTLEESRDPKAAAQIEVCKCDLKVKEIEERIARVNRRQLERSLLARKREEKRRLEGKEPFLFPNVHVPQERSLLNWKNYFTYCRGWRLPVDPEEEVRKRAEAEAARIAKEEAEVKAKEEAAKRKRTAIHQATDEEKALIEAELARQGGGALGKMTVDGIVEKPSPMLSAGAGATALGLFGVSQTKDGKVEVKKTKKIKEEKEEEEEEEEEKVDEPSPVKRKPTDAELEEEEIKNEVAESAHPTDEKSAVQLPKYLEDLSAEVTYSLTAYTALSRLHLLSGEFAPRVLEIHVVGADWKEGRTVEESVEVFADLAILLRSSNVKFLNITLIGPHVESTLVGQEHTKLSVKGDDDERTPQVCIRYSDMLYHDFDNRQTMKRSEGEYAPPPHVCMCFNAGVWVFDEWTPTVLHIYENMQVPLVITSYNTHESHEDKCTLEEIGVDESDWCFGPELNPFRSFKKIPGKESTGVATNSCVQCIWKHKEANRDYSLRNVLPVFQEFCGEKKLNSIDI